MQKIKAAKGTAKQMLKNKWHSVILVFCIVAAAFSIKMLFATFLSMLFGSGVSSLTSSVVSSVITLVMTFLELLAFSPLYIGALRWLWQVTAGAKEPLSTLFYYYETKADYLKAVSAAFGLLWRFCAYSIICMLPFVLLTSAKQMLSGSVYFGAAVKIGVYFGWVFTGITGIILLVTLMVRHYMLFPVMFADDSLDAVSAFSISSYIARGRVAPVMYMLLKFIPLMALCLLAVPIIWVIPYFAASVLTYARYMITEFRLSLAAENEPKSEE